MKGERVAVKTSRHRSSARRPMMQWPLEGPLLPRSTALDVAGSRAWPLRGPLSSRKVKARSSADENRVWSARPTEVKRWTRARKTFNFRKAVSVAQRLWPLRRATFKQAIDLIHDGTKGAQMGQSTRNAHQGDALSSRQRAFHKQEAMFEQIADLGLESKRFLALLAIGFVRTSAGQLAPGCRGFGFAQTELLAHFGHGMQHGVGDISQGMELAALVRYVWKYSANDRRIQI